MEQMRWDQVRENVREMEAREQAKEVVKIERAE
jgi:hypothetical protein